MRVKSGMRERTSGKRPTRYAVLAIVLALLTGVILFRKSAPVEAERTAENGAPARAEKIRFAGADETKDGDRPKAKDPELVLTQSVDGAPMFKVNFNDGVSEELYILKEPPPVRVGLFLPSDIDLLALTKEEVAAINQLANDSGAELKIRQLATGKIEWANANTFTLETKLSSGQASEFERIVLQELERLVGEDRKLLFLDGTESGRTFVTKLEFFGRLVVHYTFELNDPSALTPLGRMVTVSREVGGIDPRTGVPFGYRTKGAFLEKDWATAYPGFWPAALVRRPR